MIFKSEDEKRLNFHFSKKTSRQILRDREVYSRLVNYATVNGCLLTLKTNAIRTVNLPRINEMMHWFSEEIKSANGLYCGLEGHLYLSGFFSGEFFCPNFAEKSTKSAVSISKHFWKEYQKDFEFNIAIAYGSLALSNPLELKKNMAIGGSSALKIHYMLDEYKNESITNSVLVDQETRALLKDSDFSFVELSVINKPMGSVAIAKLEF